MDDGGVIILIIVGLISSLQFIARFIIESLIKKKSGETIKLSKIKILLTVLYCLFFLILLFLDLQGFIVYKE